MEFLESCVFQWPNICVDEKANNVEKANYVLRGSKKKKNPPMYMWAKDLDSPNFGGAEISARNRCLF